MRQRKLVLPLSPFALVFCALFVFFISPAFVFANANNSGFDDVDEYEETARVGRVSLIGGEVSLRRVGSKKWERATLNLPLVEGDRLATGRNSRLEIQIDARNFIRLGEQATVDIVTLRDEGVALSLVEGTATLRLARFEREREYFEIDAPGSTVAAERRGLYRLDVAAGGDVRVTVRDEGRARIYSESAGFTLRDGRTASLRYAATGSDGGDWELSSANAFDNWDTWVDDRERYLAARLRYDDRERYYDRDVWGAEELDAYGDWVHTRDYGYVWRPHVTVINHYHNWSPYRYGRWTWCPPYGWTWVGDEPWGWAPYHYGRWVYVDNNWCWTPRFYNHRRSWWRPALVAFVYVPTSYGEHVAWYPLNYHQRDPRGRHYRTERERLTPLRAGELANLRRANPIYQRAVTSLPAREFGSGTTNLRAAQPASIEIARRAVSGEPVRGRLPIRPVDVNGADTAAGSVRDRRGVGLQARPANSDAPVRAIPERPTGAATRQPGVALDESLRRERIFNGREARPALPPRTSPDATGVNGNERESGERTSDGVERRTGVIVRPSRPARVPAIENNNDEADVPARVARPTRPARPETPNESERPRDSIVDERPRDSIVNERPREPIVRERPERRRRPVEADENGNDAPPAEERRPSPPQRPAPAEERESPRPVAPPREAREERPSRPEVRERPAPEPDRPVAPPPREERRPDPPAQREQPQPREERPAAPPPPREERPAPPPREERPAPVERRPDPPARERHSARPSRIDEPN